MQKTQDDPGVHHDAEPGRAAVAPEAIVTEPRSELDEVLGANANIEIDPEDLQPKPWVLPDRRRVLLAAGIVLVLLLLVVLPPLISVNRFRHRIAQSVGESLGRPVRIDNVALNVLPMPGFTLENFVVDDDPAFSSEPVIRAQSVKVTLRVWSLWRRRVEFSRISLDDPSVNLVHRADGRWNIESILLQAAKIEAAPTAQQGAGDEPRFPYIEATGARVNVKMGLEKMPIALTEADLALWLTQPDLWKLRLEGRPTRTNTTATDTGTVRIQGTLGKASTLNDVPIDLSAEWRDAPLGGVGWVLLARDSGFRGGLTMRTRLQGTVSRNSVDTELELNDVRRADFVPQHTLHADIRCAATAVATFHQLADVRCGWPPAALTGNNAVGLSVVGQMPDLTSWQKNASDATLSGVPASGLLDVLRLASARISPELTAGGTVSGKFTCCGPISGASKAGRWSAVDGHFAIEKAALALGKSTPFVNGDVAADLAGGQLAIHPVAFDLGAPQPAMLDGSVDADGFTLHLAGLAMRSRLMQLAQALPPFGDGLDAVLPPESDPETGETPIRIDLTSSRTWTTGQTWTTAPVRPVKSRKRR
jgi:AsmA protein